jgi:hypothetical protein
MGRETLITLDQELKEPFVLSWNMPKATLSRISEPFKGYVVHSCICASGAISVPVTLKVKARQQQDLQLTTKWQAVVVSRDGDKRLELELRPLSKKTPSDAVGFLAEVSGQSALVRLKKPQFMSKRKSVARNQVGRASHATA